MREKVFYLTDDHLRLLDRMWVGWDDMEYGAPAIDPKRPYGNSDVEGDIAEILMWELSGDDYEPLSEYQRDNARRIHLQMQTVLQIVLRLRTFETGRYVNDSLYGIDWRKA